MKYDPQKHHRRSIRLPGYDYSQSGWYFVTIVIQDRENILGDIRDDRVVLTTFGQIVYYYWKKIPHFFNHAQIDEFQIMPDHLHGIIHIVRPTKNGGGNYTNKNNDMNVVEAMHSDRENFIIKTNNVKNASLPEYPQKQPPRGTQPGSLAAILQNFQSVTSRKINRIRKTPGLRLWQRNYWEHIIRNETDLNNIRKYIINNPLQWQRDSDGKNSINIKNDNYIW